MPRPKQCLALAVAGLLTLPAVAAAAPMVAVSTAASAVQTVVSFDTAAAGTFTNGPTAITGLGLDERVIGIDYRPADQLLYALARNPSTTAARLYRLDPVTGVATAVGPSFGAVVGANVDIDFNPVADRLRIVSDADQNTRLNPDTGALAASDGTLAFAGGDTNAAFNPAVSAAAYTNSFPGATTTTLYDLDFNRRVLAIQNPPNSGTLNTVGGGPPFDALGVAGMDIAPDGTALLSITSNSFDFSFLYGVNLATGATVFSQTIGQDVPPRYPFIAFEPEDFFRAEDAVAAEGAGAAQVTISRPTQFAAGSVAYSTVDGSANAGTDYTATSGTLAFAVGEKSKTVSVPITDDASDEGAANETFRIKLGPASSGRFDPVGARVAIIDDDAPKPVTPTPTPPAPDDAAPKVAFTSPPSALPVLTPVAVTAAATDDRGIARVDFMDGERVVASDAAPPYTTTYLPGATDLGRRTLVAVAVDTAGQTASGFLDRVVSPLSPTLTASTSPKRDAKGPRTFTTTGTVSVPAAVAKAAACKGATVTVKLTAGKRVLGTKKAPVSATCTYRARSSFTKRLPASLVAKASLAATPVLRAASKSAKAVRTR